MGVTVDPRPFELRRPPTPLIDAGDPRWREYLAGMSEKAGELDLPFAPPGLVPWTRKAHELAAQAREAGVLPQVDPTLYDAYFVDGRDIGRVDVLVEIGVEAGLDPTETKAALDVDRHGASVEEERRRAEEVGVRGVPTLVLGDRALEGFHPEGDIRTFLHPGDRE